MKVLVTGGTGLVGSHVVRELTSRGVEVSVLTRDPAKAKQLPQACQGRRRQPAGAGAVRRVFAGVDGVFLLNPVTQTETSEALMAVMGMREARLKRLVYLSVQNADRRGVAAALRIEGRRRSRHRRSGISFTILRPNNFFQNDYFSRTRC